MISQCELDTIIENDNQDDWHGHNGYQIKFLEFQCNDKFYGIALRRKIIDKKFITKCGTYHIQYAYDRPKVKNLIELEI